MGRLTIECGDEVESARHAELTRRGLAEALPKPDKHLSAHPAIPRAHTLPGWGIHWERYWRPIATRAQL
jgi:hypothetical protein